MNQTKFLYKAFFPLAVFVLLAAGCNQATQPAQQSTQSVNQEQTAPPVDSISYQGQDNQSALQILKAKYQVETEEYAGMGEFVTSINGVKPASDQFWAFYVNGKSSQVGASQYQTKNSDLIEWKLETINSYSE